MKKIITLVFICLFQFTNSQSKEFIVIDFESKKPIDLVQVSYPNLEIGSVSNKEGKVKIPLKKDKINISHINYIEEGFSYQDFIKKDTLFLVPKTNELEEVVLYNINLKQKFANILENSFSKKYSTKKAIHKGTYKETFTINNSLSRLFQIQLNWYSKNSLFKSNKPLHKQNILNLESVDYSKIKEINKDFISSKGAYVDNKTFFQFMHLNTLLIILKDLTSDFEIQSIQKNEKTTSVFFNATLKKDGRKIYDHQNSLVVFDKDYKYIKYLKFNMVYNSDFKDALSKIHKIPYKKKTTNHVLELSFKKLKNEKYSISYFISEVKAILKTKGFTDNISSKQSLFIAESKLGKRLKNGNIDLSKPFYKSVTNNLKNNDVKILLTEKESQFLGSKD